MAYTLDRIEDGTHAVLTHAADPPLVVPAEWLPPGAAEGDLIVAETLEEGGVRFRIDPEATRARRESMRALRDSIPRARGGDLDL